MSRFFNIQPFAHFQASPRRCEMFSSDDDDDDDDGDIRYLQRAGGS